MASVPASGPGPNTATNSSAHTSELIEREVTKTNLANRLSAEIGRHVARRKQADRHRHHDGDDGAERGDVKGLDQAFQRRPDIGQVRRPHPAQQIDHLVRRVVEEFGNDVDRAQRNDEGCDREQIEAEARQPLQRRKALPIAVQALGDGHWNTRRAQPDTISAIMIRLTMMMRMASTTSKSKR